MRRRRVGAEWGAWGWIMSWCLWGVLRIRRCRWRGGFVWWIHGSVHLTSSHNHLCFEFCLVLRPPSDLKRAFGFHNVISQHASHHGCRAIVPGSFWDQSAIMRHQTVEGGIRAPQSVRFFSEPNGQLHSVCERCRRCEALLLVV